MGSGGVKRIWPGAELGGVRLQRGVVDVPDGVRLACSVYPVHLQEISGYALACQALAQGALQGKNDQGQLLIAWVS